MKRNTFLSVLFGAALLACGSDDPAGPVDDNGDFDITVSSGTRPTYTWPAGGAFSVSVVRTTAPGTIVWGMADPVNKNVGSPVTHGSLKGSAIESAASEKTLSAGVEYRVSITLGDGKTGWKSFTP